MMKKLTIRSAATVLVGIFALVSVASAQTATTSTSSSAISNAVCPVGYICTRTVAAKPTCPIGYICTVSTSTAHTLLMQATSNNQGQVYTPGTYASPYSVLSNNQSLIRSVTPTTALPTDAAAIAAFLASTTADHTNLVTTGNTTLTSQGYVAGLTSAYVPSNLRFRDDAIWQAGMNLPFSGYVTDQSNVLVTQCRYPMTDSAARELQGVLQARGMNAGWMTSDNTLFATWAGSTLQTPFGANSPAYYSGTSYEKYLANMRVSPNRYNTEKPPGLTLARCLDAGYVSNFSQWSKYFPNITTTSGGTTQVQTGATSSTPYFVSVNYSSFTMESTANHYVSVYTSSGTKSMTVTVFKFNDSPTMTADQAIAKITSLGYRPAILAEVASLKNLQTGVVGLGTNLGGTNGYPITGAGSGGSVNSSTGLGMSAGPFNTNSVLFAAVGPQ